MAVLDNRKKEPIAAKGLPNRATRIVKKLAGYQEKGEVQIACGAGCLGYTLYRELAAFGYDCRVIPPSTVFHGGDGQVKTDYRDAMDIAWMLRRNEGESIAVPAKEDEAMREVIWCRGGPPVTTSGAIGCFFVPWGGVFAAVGCLSRSYPRPRAGHSDAQGIEAEIPEAPQGTCGAEELERIARSGACAGCAHYLRAMPYNPFLTAYCPALL
jgi:hypothetical protein